MATLNLQVVADADDGIGGDTFDIDERRIGKVNTTALYEVFARFTTVTVPQGATIDAAHTSERCSFSATGTLLLKVRAEDADDAIAPTDNAEFAALVLTSEGVDWDFATWTAGTWYDSPSIVAVVQEVIDRDSWASGNALMTVILYDGGANWTYIDTYDYNDDAASAPKLDIDYTAGAAEGQPTMIRTQGIPTGPGSRDRPGRWN